MVVEVSKGDVDWDAMSARQRAAKSGVYTQAMAAYLCWLAARYETIRQGLPAALVELREQAYRTGDHRRTAANIASLALGLRYYFDFAEGIGAVTPEARAQLWQRCWDALLQAGASQEDHQAAHEPTRQFLALLSATLASGRAHVAAPDGLQPANPGAWGWRERVVGTGDHTRDEWAAQGKRIGWLEGDNLYLEPEASYAEAQTLAKEQNESIAISAQTLRKRLHEQKLLASVGTASGRETLFVRRTIENHRRYVLHVFANVLEVYIPYKPTQPTQPTQGREGTEIGQVFDGRGQVDGQVFLAEPAQEKLLYNSGLHGNGQAGQVFHDSNSPTRETTQNVHDRGQVDGQVLSGQVFEYVDESKKRIDHLWDNPRVPHHCERCGATDFDLTRDGTVLCIPCSEKEG